MDGARSMSVPRHPLAKRILAALFYAVTSFLITVVNKIVLTSSRFPSYQFLGIGQITTTILVLFCAKQLSYVSFPDLTGEIPRKVFPLPFLFFANLVFGLGGTQKISLPMFTVLRRFTILFTMIGEYYILGVRAPMKVQLCVYLMIFGALVAASNDLAFDKLGYLFLFTNDLCTAANGVYTKKKLDAQELGKYGLLFYNALFMLPPALLLAWFTGEVDEVIYYDRWNLPSFWVQFLASCVMGFVLMYSLVLCTHFNSALTTTIIGVLKNLLVTYIGMIVGGDYIFSWVNFLGLNISVVGSIVYAYITFIIKQPAPVPPAVPGGREKFPELNEEDSHLNQTASQTPHPTDKSPA